LVALAMGAMIVGLVNSHANETLAGVELYFFAVLSSASNIRKPREFKYFFYASAASALFQVGFRAILAAQNPLAKE
jgi:hypothetical protein